MHDNPLFKLVPLLNVCVLVCIIFCGSAIIILFRPFGSPPEKPDNVQSVIPLVSKTIVNDVVWNPPDSTRIPLTPDGELIRYGHELVAHTAVYLGPKGKVLSISNGMNCQNCHLRAGKKPFGNSYAGVASTYPKYRARSGSIETIEKRVNDCIERSLNGTKLDENSVEMKAFVTYIKWVGSEVTKGVYPKGAGLAELPPLDRAANPSKGAIVYKNHCSLCHGPAGQGVRTEGNREWKYPPLCNENSYNIGAGLFRLSRFAAYVKANMPYGTSYDKPVLTDEEAWDVAAYINSLPRPSRNFEQDWPDVSTKPYDHPFGPYADNFSELQHKYGPFAPIKAIQTKK